MNNFQGQFVQVCNAVQYKPTSSLIHKIPASISGDGKYEVDLTDLPYDDKVCFIL